MANERLQKFPFASLSPYWLFLQVFDIDSHMLLVYWSNSNNGAK